MIQFPFLVVMQWADGEAIMAQSDSFTEAVDAIPVVRRTRQTKDWIVKVMAGIHTFGVVDANTGEVFGHDGMLNYRLTPELTELWAERAK